MSLCSEKAADAPAAAPAIAGIGLDLLRVDRVRLALDRWGDRFAEKILGPEELLKFHARRARDPARGVRFLATRFAAKEAFSKAVGTGFKAGVFMKDIGVVNAKSGAPTLALTGGAAARLAALIPAGHEAVVHLTLTDDHPWAQAFVVIEARPL